MAKSGRVSVMEVRVCCAMRGGRGYIQGAGIAGEGKGRGEGAGEGGVEEGARGLRAMDLRGQGKVQRLKG